jgi:catechol 2,3-dioxygenase-like lactoylglutathione lyase family enzyme
VFDHVTVRVSDQRASRRFYETVLTSLGYRISVSGDHFAEWSDFGIAQARDDRPVTRLHPAFVTRSRAEVETFWRAGTEAGYASDGEPGPRPEYDDEYYGAFLLDPDGNTVARVLGLRVVRTRPERFHVAARDRSFALVAGAPTENVHMAFLAPDRVTVDEFHRVALDAGYRDNGAPGERRYHPGYYGAFVFDPDGNNVEAVHSGTQTRRPARAAERPA